MALNSECLGLLANVARPSARHDVTFLLSFSDFQANVTVTTCLRHCSVRNLGKCRKACRYSSMSRHLWVGQMVIGVPSVPAPSVRAPGLPSRVCLSPPPCPPLGSSVGRRVGWSEPNKILVGVPRVPGCRRAPKSDLLHACEKLHVLIDGLSQNFLSRVRVSAAYMSALPLNPAYLLWGSGLWTSASAWLLVYALVLWCVLCGPSSCGVCAFRRGERAPRERILRTAEPRLSVPAAMPPPPPPRPASPLGI